MQCSELLSSPLIFSDSVLAKKWIGHNFHCLNLQIIFDKYQFSITRKFNCIINCMVFHHSIKLSKVI